MKKALSLAVVVCILVGVVSCGKREDQSESKSEKQKPIKIGAIFAATGPASFLGAPEAKTAEMLVEKINSEGGLLGRQLKLIVKDSGGSPEKAVSFAKQLIEEENVTAIIGPSTSGETLQIKPICEKAGMVLLSCAAAEKIVNPVADYVFKTPQKDSQAAAWIFKTIKDMDITQVALVTGNTGFGKAGKEQVEKAAKEYGVDIVISEVYDKRSTDLAGILTKVNGTDAEAVINWSIVPAQAIIAKNMKQLGMEIPLFQSHGFGNLKYVEQAGKAAEGIIFPCGRLLIAEKLPDDHPQKDVLVEYKNSYEDRYNESVSTFGGHAYDALMIAVNAIKQAGTTDKKAVRDAIENMQGFVGTAGTFNFSPTDHNGLDMDAFEMLTVEDGKFVPLEKK